MKLNYEVKRKPRCHPKVNNQKNQPDKLVILMLGFRYIQCDPMSTYSNLSQRGKVVDISCQLALDSFFYLQGGILWLDCHEL